MTTSTATLPTSTRELADAVGERQPARASRRRRLISAFLSLIGTVAVAAMVAVALAVGVVPALAGGHTLTVLSGSMVPDLPVGSVVVDRPVPASALHVGDVITYVTTDEISGTHILVTHRIVARRSTAAGPVFTTKGDANNVADDRSVSVAQIRGKVWYHVPYLGRARDFLLAQGAPLILLGGAVLIGALWLLTWALRADSPASVGGEESAGPDTEGDL